MLPRSRPVCPATIAIALLVAIAATCAALLVILVVTNQTLGDLL